MKIECWMLGDRLGSTLRTTYMSVDVFCHMIHDMNSANSAVWECLSDPMDLADVPAVISFADRTWELEPRIDENFIRISTAIQEAAVGMGLEITEYPLTTRLRLLGRAPDCTQYLVFDNDDLLEMVLSPGVFCDSIDDDADDDGPSRTARYGSETRVLTPYLIGRLGRYGGTKAGSCCISFAGNRRPL